VYRIGAMNTERHPVDVHVGQRLRLRRGMTSITQEKLATAVGVSFQMIQKYEKGDVRVSASRLMQLGQALGVAVEWFYEGFDGAEVRGPTYKVNEDRATLDDSQMNSKETLDVLKAYYALPDPLRKYVLDAMKRLKHAQADETDK
jgi:transcriptional regulator with XRE-family HTH domain